MIGDLPVNLCQQSLDDAKAKTMTLLRRGVLGQSGTVVLGRNLDFAVANWLAGHAEADKPGRVPPVLDCVRHQFGHDLRHRQQVVGRDSLARMKVADNDDAVARNRMQCIADRPKRRGEVNRCARTVSGKRAVQVCDGVNLHMHGI